MLNTPEGQRAATLDEDLAAFPYVNGDLFADMIWIPDFNAEMREQLLTACRFNWSSISPAIFGSLFQSVMAPAERRAQGAHYTTEQNILKVIEPLFLDGLWEEFTRIKALRRGRKARLREFQERLGELTFFDPACGCGNFLVIAYRELRRLELQVIREHERDETGAVASAPGRGFAVPARRGPVLRDRDRRVPGADRRGGPLDDGPPDEQRTQPGVRPVLRAHSAETVAAHPLRRRAGDGLGGPAAGQGLFLRVRESPFGGAKFQSAEQRAQVRRIAALGGSGGTLDYVTAWFITAGEYIQGSGPPGERARIGFVATNSITQGEQVAQLWPILFGRWGLEIAFAHRTFAWGSDARGMAHVHVVIIGLDDREGVPGVRRLFSYDDLKGDPHESRHLALSPYLFDAVGLADPHLVVREESRPINGMPQLITGSKPIDGGHLHLLCGRSSDVHFARAGCRAIRAAVHRCARVLAGWPATDPRPPRCFAIGVGEAAAGSGARGGRT